PFITDANRFDGRGQKHGGARPSPRPPAEKLQLAKALVEGPKKNSQENGNQQLDVDGLEGGMIASVHRHETREKGQPRLILSISKSTGMPEVYRNQEAFAWDAERCQGAVAVTTKSRASTGSLGWR